MEISPLVSRFLIIGLAANSARTRPRKAHPLPTQAHQALGGPSIQLKPRSICEFTPVESNENKAAARAVREYLAAIGHPISSVQAHEVVARAAGLRNKHVLAAQGVQQAQHEALQKGSVEALAEGFGKPFQGDLIDHPWTVQVDGESIPVLPLRHGPLSLVELARLDWHVNHVIPISLETFSSSKEGEGGIEDLNDAASEALTGSSCGLNDIGYEHVPEINYGKGFVAICVTGYVDDCHIEDLMSDADIDTLAQIYVARFDDHKKAQFLHVDQKTREDHATPESFMASCALERDHDQNWDKLFPKDPATMSWGQAEDLVNAAILAHEATDGEQNWGALSMSGNTDAYKEWLDAYLTHVKPLLFGQDSPIEVPVPQYKPTVILGEPYDPLSMPRAFRLVMRQVREELYRIQDAAKDWDRCLLARLPSGKGIVSDFRNLYVTPALPEGFFETSRRISDFDQALQDDMKSWLQGQHQVEWIKRPDFLLERPKSEALYFAERLRDVMKASGLPRPACEIFGHIHTLEPRTGKILLAPVMAGSGSLVGEEAWDDLEGQFDASAWEGPVVDAYEDFFDHGAKIFSLSQANFDSMVDFYRKAVGATA